jgi:threonine/homoserine/homoserine lactone efflux protein
MSAMLEFMLASLLLIAIPGPDQALITRNAVIHGRRAGMRTILGGATGLSVHAVGAAVGVSAVLAASATAFTAVKLAGMAYLLYLGVKLLRSRGAAPDAKARAGHPFLQGFASNVLNPKVALFFLTFLPQFVNKDAAVLPQTLTLAAIHVVVGLICLSAYARLVHRARELLTAPRVRAWLERTTGAVLIAFGLRVAVERR